MSNEGKGVKGLLLVVSSPSGAGKTTLSQRLRAEFSGLGFSVSYTTRKPRPSEVDGVDYHFVDQNTFENMVKEDLFAEWAEVHGHFYGTSFAAVQQALDGGRDMIFDIDYQGGTQLKSKFPDAVMVFVLPPSMKVLAERLKGRATESPEKIAMRLNGAIEELTHYDSYEFLVVNDNLETAYTELRSIYLAAGCTQRRRGYLALELLSQAKNDDLL